MEGAATGLPPVATDIRGCRQVAEDQHTGLLVPVRDPDALSAAIGWLLGGAGLRTTRGVAAQDEAEREFDDRREIEITRKVYRRLLAARR